MMKMHRVSYIVFAVLMIGYIAIDHANVSLFLFQSFIGNMTPLVLAALGELVVILVGGIDLSVGSLLSLVTVTIASGIVGHGLVSIVAVIVLGAAAGLVNGLLIGGFGLPDLVVTLSTGSIFQGAALTVMNTPGGTVPNILVTVTSGLIWVIPWALILIGVVGLLLGLIIHRTRMGKHLVATGANPRGAATSGVNVRRSKVLSYVIGGILVSFGGLILAGLTTSGDPNVGASYTLEAVAAVVLGGASLFGGEGTVSGAISGAMILTVISNIIFVLNASQYVEYIISGAILALAVALSHTRIRWLRFRPVKTEVR